METSSSEDQKAAAQKKRAKPIPLTNYIDNKITYDSFNQSTTHTISCGTAVCQGSAMFPQELTNNGGKVKPNEDVLKEAEEFIKLYYASLKKQDTADHKNRWEQIKSEVAEKGTYDMAYKELVYGAKEAWRNAPRCIGRMSWSKLMVFDLRHVTKTSEMFEAMCTHIKYATNNGKLRSAITLFPQRVDVSKEFRVWNKQMLSYAGYLQPDGTIIGDPSNIEFTQICQKLGWKGKMGRFDVLPWVLQANGEVPDLYEVPPECLLEVDITHPEFDWMAELELKWYCIPGVTSMMLDAGGIEFCAAPFSGWYMATEIAVRDFCDPQRYNVLEEVGRRMGLNTKADSTLWKDKACLELMAAVMHSFHQKNVTIVDHHTASESFMKHLETEQRIRGGCPSDWVWLVPPIGGSLVPVYHQECSMYLMKPCYFYQREPWKTFSWKDKGFETGLSWTAKINFNTAGRVTGKMTSMFSKRMEQRTRVTILYASETGRSQTFAEKLGDIFLAAFNATVYSMTDYNLNSLEKEKLILVVAATTGNGDPPENAQSFTTAMRKMKSHISGKLTNISYAVFALGSKAYRNYCSYGKWVDEAMEELGANRMEEIVCADELTGQDIPFKKWSNTVFSSACKKYLGDKGQSLAVPQTLVTQQKKLRLCQPTSNGVKDEHCKTVFNYSKCYDKDVHQTVVLRNSKLYDDESNGSTICIRLETDGSPELDYEPGDHLAVFPHNKDEIVSGILEYMTDAKEYWDNPVVLQEYKKKPGSQETQWETHERLPCVSVRTLLSRFLDITMPASMDLLEALLTFTKDDNEKQKLETLTNDGEAYEKWKKFFSPHFLEVLQEFPSAAANLDSAVILRHLPVLQPRYYSISSSLDLHRNEVHLTVGVVTYKTQDGNGPVHYGVCSNYLKHLGAAEKVVCFVRKAPSFHLPADWRLPLIMIGPGTGIAPFRGFWQQRLFQMKKSLLSSGARKYGKVVLFMGCRNKQMMLYTKEIDYMISQNAIQEKHVALSREPDVPKAYVQHKMAEVSDDIYDLLVKESGHLYVCGDSIMADDIESTLVNIISKKAEVGENEAQSFILNLKEKNRYHEDLFGNTRGTTHKRTLEDNAQKNRKELFRRQGSVLDFAPDDILHKATKESPE